jgi:hypothetical protein
LVIAALLQLDLKRQMPSDEEGGPGGGRMGSMPTVAPLDVWVHVNMNPVLPEKK